MAKQKKEKKQKFKNIELQQVELTPTTIGMFESRKKSSIGTFVILTIFILAVVFLPQITDFINSYLYPEKPNPINPNNPNTPINPDEDGDTGTNEENFYAYEQNLKIENEDLTLNSFIIDTTNNTLKYTLTNNGTNANIESLNYYIEIYNTERTLIERIKLASELTLTNGAFREITKNISMESATTIGFIVLVKKNITDYPEVTLTPSEEGTSSLVCTNTYEKVTYKFNDNKLQELTSEVSHKVEELDYLTTYETNKNLVNSYSLKTGITSTLFEYEGGYNITTNVNLKEADRLYLFNADSFKIDTEPKVVKFEMEAQGFKCN